MTDQAQGRALAPTEGQRMRVYVEDAIPIFDTDSFEHMQRIATMMARAPLVPQALKGNSPEEAIANCFLVTNQARNWQMEPFAVAQCCSVVSGKLMYEGKLVAAVIRAKLGLDLHYWTTGEKGKDDFRVYASDQPFDQALVDQLAPGKTILGKRIVDGSVGEWKTTNEKWKSQPDIQLRYRAARVWCRVFEPAVMLGVYTDDELDAGWERRDARRDGGQPGPKALSSGFGEEATPRAIEGKAVEVRRDEPQAEEEPHDPATGELLGDGSGTAAPELQETQEEITSGHAGPGEVYLLAGDPPPTDEHRRKTYKDGQPFSAVGEPGAAKLKVYGEHSPEAVPAEEESQDQEQAQEQTQDEGGGAPAAESSEPAKEETKADPAAPKGDFGLYRTHLEAANGWLGVKQALRTLGKSDDWQAAEAEGQRMARLSAWERYEELGDTSATPGTDVVLFRIWLETTPADADLSAAWKSLIRTEDYRKLPEERREELGGMVQAILAPTA